MRESDKSLFYKLKLDRGELKKCAALDHAPRVRRIVPHASAWRSEEFTTSSATGECSTALATGDTNADRDAMLWPRFRRSMHQGGGAQTLFKVAKPSYLTYEDDVDSF